jgi:TfoX/Sxy family transcriptional regulator of competence genes
MAFDVNLAARLRDALIGTGGVTEKSMFGGKAFLLDGNMLVGVIQNDLVARVGPERFDAAVARKGVRPFDFSGRPMSGWVMVAPEGCDTDTTLGKWVDEALDYVRTLPKK